MDGPNYRLQLLINADNVASITVVLQLMVVNFFSVACISLFMLKQMWLFHLTTRSVQSLNYASVFHCIPATWSNASYIIFQNG